MIAYGTIKEIRDYLRWIFIPVTMISAGSFAGVLNNMEPMNTLACISTFVWIFAKIGRISLTKHVQSMHMNKLSITRFIRLIYPFMMFFGTISFFVLEYDDVINGDGFGFESTGLLGDFILDQFCRLVIYAGLLTSGLTILYYGKTAVEYTTIVVFRELLWNIV